MLVGKMRDVDGHLRPQGESSVNLRNHVPGTGKRNKKSEISLASLRKKTERLEAVSCESAPPLRELELTASLDGRKLCTTLFTRCSTIAPLLGG
jgi:hypothetical protein